MISPDDRRDEALRLEAWRIVEDAKARHGDCGGGLLVRHMRVGLVHAQRMVVGVEMHRDAGGRKPNEIVPIEGDRWRDALEATIAMLARDHARLDARRASFDPEGLGLVAPRRAWDVNPATAAILAAYPRLPAFDGSHRLDGGAGGRLVQLDAAPGVACATIAYGDGVVRLVEAHLSGGASLVSDDAGRPTLRLPGSYPDTLRAAMVGRRPADIAAVLAGDPRTDLLRTRVTRDADGLTVVMSDLLVPWARNARGDETWRSRGTARPRTAARRSNRHAAREARS